MDPRPVRVTFDEARSTKLRWLQAALAHDPPLTGLASEAFDRFFIEVLKDAGLEDDWERIEKGLSRHLRVVP